MRTALYIRVSTQEQAMHGLSLEAQETTLRKYADQHNLIVVGLYADEGISARKSAKKRPSLQRLLEDIKQDKIDMVLFIKLDRWFRNIAEYYKVQEILEQHNVVWKCTQEDYETETASGRLKVNIMLSVAQDEADRTSERIKFVLQTKRDKQEAYCGNVPFGYKIQDKKIVIDEDKKPIVDKFFKAYLETGSTERARRLVPELPLRRTGVNRMLKSNAYTGDFNGIIVPPYITTEQHEAILKNMKNFVRDTSKKYTYLFVGLIVCGECWHRFGARTQFTSKGTPSKNYYCYSHNCDKAECNNKVTITEKKIEKYLLDHIDDEIVKLKGKDKTPKDNSDKIKKIEQKLARLNDLYIDGDISKEAHDEKYNVLKSEIEKLKTQVIEANSSLDAFTDDWKDIYLKLNDENKAIFWRSCIKKIIINNDRTIEFYL